MNYLLAFIIFGLCITGMAVGLIFARKVLKKGCSLGQDCTCRDQKDSHTAHKDCEHQK